MEFFHYYCFKRIVVQIYIYSLSTDLEIHVLHNQIIRDNAELNFAINSFLHQAESRPDSIGISRSKNASTLEFSIIP